MTVKGKKILITGGTGFIGSATAERLADDNDLVLYDLKAGGPIEYTDLLSRPNVQFVQGDICDPVAMEAALEGVDIVIHAAAVVGVHNVLSKPRLTIETNFTGTQVLLSLLKDRKLDRFVYFSTSEVFGGASFRADEAHHATIGTIQEARWSYSIAKLAGEHLCYAYYREFGLPVVIVRPFNVFGPKRTGDHAMLRFVLGALQDQPLEVHGDGSQVRAWCYIDDFVDALLETLTNDAAVGEDFNIGNPMNTLTIYELAKRTISLAKSKSEIIFHHIDYSDIDIRVPRTVKAREVLNWKPKFETDEGVTATLDWYRDHLDAFADRFSEG